MLHATVPRPFDVTARVTSRAMSATACKFYLAGACRNGASCRFSHDADASASASARASTETRERCKFVDAPGGCTFCLLYTSPSPRDS